jgi:hypothetical protein
MNDNILTKVCTKCKQEKSVSEFYKHKLGGIGLSPRCKSCLHEYNKEYYKQMTDTPNRKEIGSNLTKVCFTCKVEKPINEFHRSLGSRLDGLCSYCKSCVKEKQKKDYPKYKERIRKNQNEYRLSNPEKFKEIRRKWHKKHKQQTQYQRKQRMKTDIGYKLRCNLRSRFKSVIKRNHKTTSCITLLGCSIEHFKYHIESLFQEGMTWENHKSDGWHIDHIIPCSSFDLTDIEQQKKCFHYTNLQPLWWYDNLAKGAKLQIEN